MREQRPTMKQYERKPQSQTLRFKHICSAHLRLLVVASLAGAILAVLCSLPAGPWGRWIPVASAHALPIRSDPAPHSILHSPPSQVTIWFDDALIVTTSHMTVENASGQEVDRRDSRVNPANHREMSVALAPSLAGGTYTVLWVAQSADDGHVTQGSFSFQVIGQGLLPPAHQTSGGTSAITLDGPVIVQAIATWLALLCTTFWVGGLIWETWVLPPGASHDADLEAAACVAARRFRQLTPAVLCGILVANVGLLLALEAEQTGGWSSLFQLAPWRTVLLGSFFGIFWWMREAVALSALFLGYLAVRHGWSARLKGVPFPMVPPPADPAVLPDWGHAVLATWRGIPRVPRQLVAGWRARSWLGRAEIALGGALLLAFALSGHAAAVPPHELGYALSVDLLHLVGNATWVGGLLYIGFVLTPILGSLGERCHARVLAQGLPRFSALAIICAILLAATGSLNATIHLTSPLQFLTTLYGQVLGAKIEFFLLMVVISTYHAFVLRPWLTQALRQSGVSITRLPAQPAPGATSCQVNRSVSFPLARSRNKSDQKNAPLPERTRLLAARMDRWLRREAMLGAAVLVCVALLSIFASTLLPS